MPGWTREKADIFKEEFYGFLGDVRINSKEKGQIILGENLYRAQHRFFDAVFDGLVGDVHDFKHTKSRQLGISTGSRMLTLFWAGVHDGLRGYMVFDTGAHAEEARLELLDALKSLPRHRKFPRVERENRYLIELSNGTRISFAAAGIKESKSSGTLGRSSGINFVHCSECCSWAGGEGLVAFQNALAQDFPDRLYIWESTGRGYNLWYEMYEEAKTDHRQRALFSGWWAKDNQIITPDDPDFDKYGMQAPTPREMKRMAAVEHQYGWRVTREQLAWIRRNSDPNPEDNGDAPNEYEATAAQTAEQCWIDSDCFQLPGSQFFSSEALQKQATHNVRAKFLTYAFFHGIEFADLKVERARNSRSIELKIWEEPIEDSVYVVTADPAFGYNEKNDRSAVQVCRCYADGLEQVAEYAWPLITTDQFAHVILGIAAWYSGERSQVYLMVELNGPGEAVWKEIRNVQTRIKLPYFAAKMQEKGLGDIFRNVRNYIYSRPDSMSAGSAWQWKCLALDTALPTPSGWTTMGAVQAGDWLLDDQGKSCRVVRATGAMEGHPCYQITFEDKTSIVADDEHLWSVQMSTYTGLQPPQLVRTEDLLPGKHKVPTVAPLVLPDANLSIHPYVLGVWLGDGRSREAEICGSGEDLREIAEHLKACGATLSEPRLECAGRSVYYFHIKGLDPYLQDEDLLNNKHIPAAYLRGSYWQRLNLLQGLMDTDGCIDTTNSRQCSFSTSNPRLAAGFAELVRTLGMKAKFCMRHRVLKYRGRELVCSPAWQFSFASHPDLPMFKLRRKVERQAWTGNLRPGVSKQNRILSVAPVGSVPVKCIEVDSPSHLYLAGDGMIPTHNTGPQQKETMMNQLQAATDNGTLVIRSMASLEEMRSVQRDGGSIEATGSNKDDRVVTLAMAVVCWFERVRGKMMQARRTRDFEHGKHNLSVVDRVQMFNQSQLDTFFAQKTVARRQAARAAIQNSRRR